MAMTKRKCPACGELKTYRSDQKSCGCRGSNPFAKPVIAETVSTDDRVKLNLERAKLQREGTAKELNALRSKVLDMEQELSAYHRLDELSSEPLVIPSRARKGESESVAVAVLSDWHDEELVLPGQVGGKNKHNLEIADERFANLLTGMLTWFKIEARSTKIKTFLIGLLGDFITGSIHDDLAESNLLPPTDAIYRVQGKIIYLIQRLLEEIPEDVQLVFVCHGGNHGRMTKQQRISTAEGNSLEQYMFFNLRDFFKGEKRITFQIASGYHSFTTLFDNFRIRWHHGHQINYQGGVGGLTIPVKKAIANWNKATNVDLDVFGHFHQKLDGGSFISNGCTIGYNAYAVSIKAEFEEPSQTIFLVNKEYRAKTMVAPIFVRDPKFVTGGE